MEAREYFIQLVAIYDKIPPMTCLNCQECCHAARVDTYVVEYQYIKKYIDEGFSSEQKKLLEKRIMRSRFIEVVYQQKKEIIPRLPCVFMDGQNKNCLVYPARPFLCRLHGLKGDRGSCENVEISIDKDFDIKNVIKLLKDIKNISKSYISKYGVSGTDFDYLQNWLYIERFGENSRLPLKKDKQFYGVDFKEFFVL